MKLNKKNKLNLCITLALCCFNSFATQQLFVADDGKTEDGFGYGVAIDGTTALVGALKADTDGIRDTGAAYVYVLDSNGWQQQAKLVAKPAFSDDTLGGKVVLKGDMAMLGVMRRDDRGKDSGAVMFFERQADIWQQRHIFTAPDAQAGDAFGQSIALSENHLVIGAPRNDVKGKDSGAAYIYQREGNKWRYQTKIAASDGAAGDLFGISAAIDGNTILIGADLHDEKGENAGAVYAYVLKDGQWQQQAKMTAEDPGHTDIFGVRVAISNDTALISARRDDNELGKDAGAAYVFVRNGDKWTQQVKLISPDGKADDRFGRGVALSGDTAIISAMHHDAAGSNTGALYVYKNGSDGWQFTSKHVAKGSKSDDKFGWNVGLSGDLAIMGGPFHDAKGKDSGAVFIQRLD